MGKLAVSHFATNNLSVSNGSNLDISLLYYSSAPKPIFLTRAKGAKGELPTPFVTKITLYFPRKIKLFAVSIIVNWGLPLYFS